MNCIVKRGINGQIDRVFNPIALEKSKSTAHLLVEHLKSILKQNVIIDEKLFNEKLQEAGIPRLEANSVAYGFVQNNIIYLDPNLINSDTIFHELSHINDNMLEKAADDGDSTAITLLQKRNEIVDPIVEQTKNNLRGKFGDSTPFKAEERFNSLIQNLEAKENARVNFTYDYVNGPSTLTFRKVDDRTLSVENIYTLEDERGKGNVRNAFNAFINETDKLGYAIQVMVSPRDASTTAAGIISFNESLGFEFQKVNGIESDFEMVRYPRKTQPNIEEGMDFLGINTSNYAQTLDETEAEWTNRLRGEVWARLMGKEGQQIASQIEKDMKLPKGSILKNIQQWLSQLVEWIKKNLPNFNNKSENEILSMSMKEFIRTSAGNLISQGPYKTQTALFDLPPLKIERRGTTPFDRRAKTPAVRKALNTEVFDPTSIAMQMILGGMRAKTSTKADLAPKVPGKIKRKGVLTEIFGGPGKHSAVLAEQNQRLLLVRTNGLTLNEMAHEAWMNQPIEDRYTTEDFKEAIIDIYSNYFNEVQLAEYINNKYNQEFVPTEADIRRAQEQQSFIDENQNFQADEETTDDFWTPWDDTPQLMMGGFSEEELIIDDNGMVVGVRPEIVEEIEEEKKLIKKRSKKDKTWLKAPNGSNSNLNETQWLNVRTKRFKKWSKNWNISLLDEKGEPAIFYHQTRHSFSEFQSPTGMNFFTRSEEEASRYKVGKRPGNLYKVFLISENPLDIVDSVDPKLVNFIEDNAEALYKQMEEDLYSVGNFEDFVEPSGLTYEFGESIDFESMSLSERIVYYVKNSERNWYILEMPLVQNFLKNNNYTSFSTKEGGQQYGFNNNIAIYNSNQIKSATENEGTFSNTTNNIYFSINENIESELFNQIASNPHIQDAEQAKNILFNTYTEKFKKFFGDWLNGEGDTLLKHPGGEPKLFYRSSNGVITTDFSTALDNSQKGIIEAGFISTDDVLETDNRELFTLSLSDFTKLGEEYKLENPDSFMTVFQIDSNSNPAQPNGFINKMIRQGILSGEKVKSYDGKFLLKGSGDSIMTQNANSIIAQSEAILHLGVTNVFMNSQGHIEIAGSTPDIITIQDENAELNSFEKTSLINELDKGRYNKVRNIVGNLGAFLYNSYRQNKESAFQNNSIEPVKKEEETLLSTQMLDLLSNLGVSVTTITEYVQNYKQRNGVDLGVEAIADVANNVVAFAEGAMNEQNLTEETAHIIIEATNQEEIDQILPEVESTPEYLEYADVYYEKYEKLYSGIDLDKAVRKEILGKVLANSIRDGFYKSGTIYSNLLDILNNFITLVHSYFIPNHRTQLNKFIKRTSDIALRKDATNFLDKELLGQSSILLYSVNGNPAASSNRKTAKLKAQLEKLKQSLEIKRKTQVKLKDPEVSSITTAINKLNEDILNEDLMAAASVSLAVHDGQIKSLQRQLEYYKKQTQNNGKKPFFNQADQASYNYLKNIALPITIELRGLVVEDNPSLASKMDSQIALINQMEGDVYAQQLDDVEAMVEDVVGAYSITEDEKQKIRDSFKQEQRDVSGFQSLFGQLGHASNSYLNFLGKLINKNYYNAEINTLSTLNPVLEKADSKNWNINDFRKVIKRHNGKNSGYLISKLNYAKFDEDVSAFEKQAFEKILTEDKIKALGRDPKKSDLTLEQLQEFNRMEIAWKEIHEERAMLPEYYTQVEDELSQANVGLSNRSFLSELSARTYKVKAKYRDNQGKIDYSRMSQEDIDTLAQVALDRKARKNEFDSITGERKTGQELADALELQALDKLRAEKAIKRGTSKDFFIALKEVEDEQGPEASYQFMMANGGLVFSDSFWDSLGAQPGMDDRINRASEMLIEEGDAEGAAALAQGYVSYIEASDARKAILKQYATPNNPAEINTSLMPEQARETILTLEESIQENQVLMNTQLKKLGQDSIKPTLTENTVNEAYYKDLQDSKLPEEEFIAKHLTKNNKYKYNEFRRRIERLVNGRSNYIENGFKRFISEKYGADFNDVESIIETVKNVGEDQIVTDYGKSKIASYYKRFAPFGYEAMLQDIKNGASTYELVIKIENGTPGYENYQVSTRFEWADLDAANSMVNPDYQNDTESGSRKPKKSLYRDNEYYQRFNPDVNGIATTNVEEFDMIQTFQGLMREALMKYGENSRNINKLPQKSRQTFERSLKSQVSGFKESVKDLIFNRVDDLQQGEVVDGINASELGVNLIPKYFLNNLENPEDISEDLIYSYSSLLREANLYNERENTMGNAMMLRSRLLSSQFEGGKSPDTTYAAKMFDNFTNAYFFGIKNSKKVTATVMGKEIDISKMTLAFDRWTRFLGTSFSAPIAISSALTSNINLKIEQSLGESTNSVSAKWARNQLPKLLTEYAANYGKLDRKDTLYMLGETFGFHSTQDKTKNAGYNKILKAMSDLPYAFMSVSAAPHNNNVMLSVLDDFRLVGDRFYSYNEFIKLEENKGKSKAELKGIWKTYQDKSMFNLLEPREGTMRFKEEVENQVGKEYASEQIQRTRTKVREINGNIDALISPEDRSAATRHWFLSFLTGFRSYLFLGIQRRFKREHFNFNSGNFEAGTYRSLGLFLQDLMKMSRANGYSNLMKTMGQEWNKLSEVDQNNIKRAGKDLAAFSILTALMMVVANIDDDEKNKDSWPIHFMSYLLYRTTTEIGTGQLPFGALSAVDVVKEPFTSVNRLSSIMEGLNLDEVKSGYYKGHSKLYQTVIKQTMLKNLADYDTEAIYKKSKYFRKLNSEVLFMLDSKKDREEENEVPQGLGIETENQKLIK